MNFSYFEIEGLSTISKVAQFFSGTQSICCRIRRSFLRPLAFKFYKLLAWLQKTLMTQFM